jgi:hypothetical protein
MGESSIALASSDQGFVRDCLACIRLMDTKPGVWDPPIFASTVFADADFTPLEATLTVTLAHARVASLRADSGKQAELVDKVVARLFHGAKTRADISTELWTRFTQRVRALRGESDASTTATA